MDDSAPRRAATAGTAFRSIVASVTKTVEVVQGLRPVRVALRYNEKAGPILASGLAFNAVFAVFAAIWVGFSAFGILLDRTPELRDSLVASIAQAVPGLIDTGDGNGAIDPETLLESQSLTWTGVVALAVLLWTAIGFLGTARSAVRVIFDLDPAGGNFLLVKLRDLGLAVAFGLAVVVSTAISVASTSLAAVLFDFLGIGSRSPIGAITAGGIGFVIVFALDAASLAGLYRVLAGIPIPFRRLLEGALVGALALGVLKLLGNALLGGASRNPLLASFSIIIGLLVFFNLVCQVILAAASWVAVGMADAGIAADPAAAEAEQRERERIAELERLAAHGTIIAAPLNWLRRVRSRLGRGRENEQEQDSRQGRAIKQDSDSQHDRAK